MDKLDLLPNMRLLIEENLQAHLDEFLPTGVPELAEMVRYHMGWIGDQAGPQAQGKRIRPILTLLSSSASGGDWHTNLPMASAIEYIHNFSLIHDDIQDHSATRRGRPTLWTRWGIAQAINTGDFMFTLAHLCAIKLAEEFSSDIVLEALNLFDKACIDLTYGQHLDLWFENLPNPSLDQYWKMIGGKTAALLSCTTEVGSLLGGASPQQKEYFKEYGAKIGLAFQVVDDWLGIWGDQQLTGKSSESDLVAGKKTLPILFALQENSQFAARWAAGNILPVETAELSEKMTKAGAKDYTEKIARQITEEAITALNNAAPKETEAKNILLNLTADLTYRQH